MYRVISANSKKFGEPANNNWKLPIKKFLSKNTNFKRFQEPNRSWRIYEKENLEKHLGPVIDVDCGDNHSVLDTYEKYKDTVEFIRWFPDSENCSKEEYASILNQNKYIDLKYITNSAKGFLSVQSKDESFKLWQRKGVNCPDYFTFKDSKDFKEKFSLNKINYPFLLRVNNSVSGEDTVLVKKEIELNNALNVIEKSNRNRIGINRKMMCIEFINTIDNKRNVNVSYRIHVAGNKVISGYARVVSSDNWLAITAGSFKIEFIDNWIYYNLKCQKFMEEREKEIVDAVKALGLNHQGVDLVFDEDRKKLCFLEVQPTYAAGYPKEGYYGYSYPFYNPSDPALVKFLLDNKSELEKQIPMYYNNWLDKNNHFNLVYKELKNVWS
mgnify:CR=1 FL=1|tara:strand:- start:7076 stop:8224 length:1149 start_codon:yes stop_codon:yes gene_type:complete